MCTEVCIKRFNAPSVIDSEASDSLRVTWVALNTCTCSLGDMEKFRFRFWLGRAVQWYANGDTCTSPFVLYHTALLTSNLSVHARVTRSDSRVIGSLLTWANRALMRDVRVNAPPPPGNF